jgi:TatD DNase family protein
MAGDNQPQGYCCDCRVLTGAANVLITPGLHPEIAHERAGELDLLLTQMGDVAAVGEVGLDGSFRYRKSYDIQRGLFEAIIERSSALGGRVLSIPFHAKL